MHVTVTDTPSAPSSGASGPSTPDGQRRRRLIAMSIWSVAFVACWLLIGLPTDPLYAFAWLWAATIAWRSEQPWRNHLGFARDWLPVVLLLALYNLSRGFADNGAVPHAYELIAADIWMFGWAMDGQIPTIWLQQHLYDPNGIHWWDIAVSWVYFSHFVVTLAAAVVLWLRDRARWGAFMRRWGFLCASGLVTYFAYPAAPPWWAAQYGLLEEVARISTRGWREFGMHGAGNLLNAGQIASNPVAAMPSLHTAWALFVVVFFLGATRRRWWPLLLCCPLAMTFTLVYAGEHYVIDVLVGWAYVGLAFLAVGLAERWWAARRARRAVAAPEPTAAGDPATVSTAPNSTVAGPAVPTERTGSTAAGPAVPTEPARTTPSARPAGKAADVPAEPGAAAERTDDSEPGESGPQPGRTVSLGR